MEGKFGMDESLWAELKEENPSEEKLKSIVANGAKIDGPFLKQLLFWFYPPYREDEPTYKPLDNKYVKLFVELGADPFYAEPGEWNILWDACECWNPELVEYFLKLGLDPNTYSKEGKETLLDWVGFAQQVEAKDWLGNAWRDGGVILAKIMDLLKQYAAKYSSEIEPNERTIK